MNKPAKTRLPNGEHFYCSRRFDVPAYYREIVQGREYFKHGIALADNAVVFDVGANIGMFAYAVSREVPSARVFSFEPVPATYSALYWNTQLHAMHNVTPINCGLSSASGSVQLTYFPYSAGWSTMFPNWSPEFMSAVDRSLINEQHLPAPLKWCMHVPGLRSLLARGLRAVQLAHTTVEARVETLSAMMRRYKVERIDLLKIDVERAEAHVLDGIDEDDWNRIEQWVIEVQIDHDSLNAQSITRRLQARGLDVVEEASMYLRDAQGRPLTSTLYATKPKSRSVAHSA